MSVFDNTSKQIDQTLGQGFDQAEQNLSPYTQNAGTDFNNARNALYGGLEKRAEGPHYNDEYFNAILGKGPEQLEQEAFAGFANSPEAKTAQMASKIGTSQVENQANASGMGGSGNEAAIDSQVQNGIMTEQEGNYLKHLSDTLNIQQHALGQFNEGTQSMVKMFQSMLGREYGAERQDSEYSMRTSEEEARNDERDRDRPGTLDQIASLLGAGTGIYDVFKNKGSGDKSSHMLDDALMAGVLM